MKIQKPFRRTIEFKNDFWETNKFPIWKEEPTLSLSAFLSVLLNIGAWILIISYFSNLPPEIPLYYAKIGGEALTVKKNLYFLPLGFAFFTLWNYYLAHRYYQKEKLLSQLLIHICLALNLLLILIILKLLYLTGLIF